MSVSVIGAGISGVSCAAELDRAGVPVRVLERSTVIGGRMFSPVVHGRAVDVGAPYFTARDPQFIEVVARWRNAGLVREWTRDVTVFEPGGQFLKRGPIRWVSTTGTTALVENLAGGLDINLNHDVRKVGLGPDIDGHLCSEVVLAMPDPSACNLLGSTEIAAVTRTKAWAPCQVVAAGFPTREWKSFTAGFVNNHPILERIFDDGDRQGDQLPILVAHTTAAASDEGAGTVVDSVRQLLSIESHPTWVRSWYWNSASPAEKRLLPFHLGAEGISLAGDGWGNPRVETAYLSGLHLARALIGRLSN